jgi:periplasmic divalent cation tolerance protein
VIEFVQREHSYDCPAVLALPIQAGHKPFLQWIDEETEGADAPDTDME